MSQNDFICSSCKETQGRGYLRNAMSVFNLKKHKCPKCGDLCNNCITSGLLTHRKCKACSSKVISKYWDNNKWVQY